MPRRTRAFGAQLRALATINRLRPTIGYTAASVALAVGIGALVAPAGLVTRRLCPAGLYALGAILLKLQASIADAIHDRTVDAANPEKSAVATAVMTVGGRRAWTLLVVELVVGMVLVGAAAILAAGWLLPAGAIVAVSGFVYSYPPRVKERGVWNHVLTTGVDAGLLVLPVAVVVGGGLTAKVVVVVGIMVCYSFGYHVMHQAADVYYDRVSGVETFATARGVANAVTVATGATAAATGLALALRYPLAALAMASVTGYYLWLYTVVVEASTREACSVLSRRFNIAWIASLLNGSLAAAVWRRALGYPGVVAVLAWV